MFAGVVTFYAKDVDLSLLLADHCHPSSGPFLNEQVLLNINDKVQSMSLILRAASQDKPREM